MTLGPKPGSNFNVLGRYFGRRTNRKMTLGPKPGSNFIVLGRYFGRQTIEKRPQVQNLGHILMIWVDILICAHHACNSKFRRP
jgi:hypothetical protein